MSSNKGFLCELLSEAHSPQIKFYNFYGLIAIKQREILAANQIKRLL